MVTPASDLARPGVAISPKIQAWRTTLPPDKEKLPSRRPRRVGADPAFAKAITRMEFGRFYTDDREQREIARDLAPAKALRRRTEAPKPPPQVERQEKRAASLKINLSRRPRVRERRAELEVAWARLRLAAQQRRNHGGQRD
jgi:hypothetical protein